MKMQKGLSQSNVETGMRSRMLFKPASWLATIDFINHLVLFNDMLIVVLSEKEGGKTSFASLLQNNLDQQIKSVSIKSKPECTEDELIVELRTKLQLNQDANKDLATLAAEINQRKEHVLLIIDEAHHIPASLVKEAIVLIKEQENFGFFHLCLIANYSMVACLNDLALAVPDNLIHSIELGPLNENEARTYVLQRAMAADLITEPLTDLQFKEFYQLTKGNLAKINANLQSFIQKSCSAQKKNKMKYKIKVAGVAASVALIAGFVGFYLASASLSYTPTQLAMADKKEKIIPEKVEQEQQELSPLEEPEELASEIPSWQNSAIRQQLDDGMPTDNAIAMADSTDKVVGVPKLKVKVVEEKTPKVATVEYTQFAPAAKSSKLNQHSASPSKLNATFKKYTIQVAAGRDKNKVEQFRQNKLLGTQATVRRLSNQKGGWYVLTLGEYKNRTQAQQNISKLPTELAKLNPWVRPISDLG